MTLSQPCTTPTCSNVETTHVSVSSEPDYTSPDECLDCIESRERQARVDAWTERTR